MLALALALLLTSSVAAHAASGPLPADVTARMEEDKKDCGASASLEKGFITRKDVNGDGIEDFILDYGHFVCDGSRTFCGSGGCTTAVYASSNGQFVKVLDDLLRDLRFATIKGRPAVLIGLHGSACGKAGSAACGETLYWNGSKFSPAH